MDIPGSLSAWIAGAALAGALAWWTLRMSWATAKRDAALDALASRVDALTARVSEHDDLRERMARVETTMEAVHASVLRVERRMDAAFTPRAAD